MRELRRRSMTGAWALSLALLVGCTQERNKSIELMNRGVEAGRQKLFERAITELKQAAATDPTNHLAHFNLGMVYKDQKKWPEAVTAFSEALKYEGDNTNYRYELANAYQQAGRLESARTEFEATLKLDNRLYKAHYQMAMVLQALEKFAEADQEYRKAIELNPRFPQPFVRLGNLYLDNDYDQEAAQVFRAGIKIIDTDADLHNGLGEALRKLKQYEGAVPEFKRAMELSSGDVTMAIYNLGMTYKAMDDRKNAKEWLQKFVASGGGKGGADYVRAAQDAMYQLDAQ